MARIQRSNNAQQQQQSKEHSFLRDCARFTACLAAASLACLLPVFAVGGNYYECGDAMMKYSTIAYLADSPVLEQLAAGLLGLYTLALAILLSRFVPSPRDGVVVTEGGEEQGRREAGRRAAGTGRRAAGTG